MTSIPDIVAVNKEFALWLRDIYFHTGQCIKKSEHIVVNEVSGKAFIVLMSKTLPFFQSRTGG